LNQATGHPGMIVALNWKMREREGTRQGKARQGKARSGRFERITLKEKVETVLTKGPTPGEGEIVMMQWYKRDGDKAMSNTRKACFLAIAKHTPTLLTITPTLIRMVLMMWLSMLLVVKIRPLLVQLLLLPLLLGMQLPPLPLL
jgi:hypothetical protein